MLKAILLSHINYRRFLGPKQVGERLYEDKYNILKAILLFYINCKRFSESKQVEQRLYEGMHEI
jgi:hypothetical protein